MYSQSPHVAMMYMYQWHGSIQHEIMTYILEYDEDTRVVLCTLEPSGVA